MKLSYSDNRGFASVFAFSKTVVRLLYDSHICHSQYWIIASVFIVITTGFAAANHCDVSIRGVSDHPFGYRMRGDRCEGIYWEPYSDTGVLALVSLVTLPKTLPGPPANQIKLHWRTPSLASSTPRHVRASSLVGNIYYRLDANQPAKSQSFAWPLEIIEAIELPLDAIGFLVTSDFRVGGMEWQGYIPVSVSRPPQQGIRPRIELIFLSDSMVEDISWRRYKLSGDGMPGSLLDEGSVEEIFSSGELIKIILPVRSDTPASYIEVNGISMSGDAIVPLSAQFVLIESQ